MHQRTAYPPDRNLFPPDAQRPNNRLLRVLPAESFRRLSGDLKRITAEVKHVFFRPGESIDFVYFPTSGMASVTTVLANGTMIEAATIGNEGMVGLEGFLGDRAVAPGETMMQVAGDAEMLSISAFRREVRRHEALYELIGRYTQTVIAQMMHSAACNSQHPVQERCARWLLLTHDRVPGDEFRLSHEFLGVMLGVRRQTVSVVAGTLQEAGLIRYSHGQITILDRAGLEAASCECYELIRAHFDRLHI